MRPVVSGADATLLAELGATATEGDLLARHVAQPGESLGVAAVGATWRPKLPAELLAIRSYFVIANGTSVSSSAATTLSDRHIGAIRGSAPSEAAD